MKTIIFSLGGLVASIFSILCIVSFWFCWIAGLVPSLWLAVRNAPTLRVRRYLILTSLRLHFLFALIGAWVFTVVSLFTRSDYVHIAGWSIVGLIAAIVLQVSIFGYRRVFRQDAGLIVPKKAVPLEESPLSYKRLVNSFRWYGITILVLFLWMIGVQVAAVYLLILQGSDPFQATCCGPQGWEMFLRSFGMQYILVGLFCLIMFRTLHRRFLKAAKDAESFAAIPAIVTHDTPFRHRVFVEWLISFGLFIVAGLYGLLYITFATGWIPRAPVTLFAVLVLLLAVTTGAAMQNVRLQILRWLVNPIVVGLIVGLLYISTIMSIDPSKVMGWNYLPFRDFFDTAQSYPVLFGLMVLSAIIVFAMATTLILGVFYLCSKTTGRFFSRRTITLTFGVQIVAVLVASAFLYTPVRVPCLTNILVCRYRDDWTTHHNVKMSALASEIIRSTSETDRLFGWANGIRAEMNLRERKFDEAVADFDGAIRLSPFESWAMHLYLSRGEAKLASGDFSGALADFEKSISFGKGYGLRDHHYNRGFAHEKLGNIEAALADYDNVIENAKRFYAKPPVVSAAPRVGYDDESRRKIHNWRYGYVISFEELVEIRERLAKETRQTP